MAPAVPALLPQPRVVTPLDGAALTARSAVLAGVPRALEALRAAADGTVATLRGHPDGVDVVVTVEALDDIPLHAYTLAVDASGVHIGAGDAHGLLYATQTLAGLWRSTGGALPQVQVRDRPTFTVRGVYAESTRGPDLMTLTDWCTFVDQLAALRITHLGMALYGCWDLRHDADPSEFLFVPLDAHPRLRTARRVRTWDPHLEQEVVRQVTPVMFDGDFFGRVVAHARARGVDIVPSFAGPSHSTLLPRVHPELSARDRDGTATGYGYCTTHPAARARLRAIVTNLIDQHLAPAGITTMGCGGDEYYPIRNLDPDDPQREIAPSCRCEGCADLTPGAQLLAYYQLVGPLLADAGIRMAVWHDSLRDLGVLEQFARWAGTALDVPPVVAWWRYSDPLPDIVPAGLETWVTPTTGLVPCLAMEDHSLNIESWLRRGFDAGATGVYAYNTPDPVNHKNYACLADLAWNLEGSGGAAGFKRRWCEIVCPDDADRAALAYALGEQILGDHSAVTFLLDHLLAYFSTAPWGAVRFPDDVLAALSVPSPALTQVLTHWAASLRRAGHELPPTTAPAPWPDPGATWRAEMGRLADHLLLVTDVVAALRGPPSERAGVVDDLLARGTSTLRRIAHTRVAYQAPYVLREHWLFIRELTRVLTATPEPSAAPAHAPWQAWQF